MLTALFTSTSRRFRDPKNARTAAASPTSNAALSAEKPSPCSSPSKSLRRPKLRPFRITCAPASHSARDMARPRCPAAPETNAVQPSRRNRSLICSSFPGPAGGIEQRQGHARDARGKRGAGILVQRSFHEQAQIVVELVLGFEADDDAVDPALPAHVSQAQIGRGL